MSILRWTAAVCLALTVFSTSGQAAGYFDYVDNLEVRPDVGYGYAVSTDHKEGLGYHAGIRILSNVRSLSTAVPVKRYGIELSVVSPFESKEALRLEKYMALGIMLEQTLPAQFVITIGTLGYIGVDRSKNNPFGLLTEIGWERMIGDKAQLFAALRYESIYDTSTISRYSLSGGIKFTVF